MSCCITACVGVLMPSAVYNHPAAIAHPWRWAAVHGGFVLAASIASIVNWRIYETTRAQAELILHAAGEGIYGVDRRGHLVFANPAAARMLGRPCLHLDWSPAARPAAARARRQACRCIPATCRLLQAFQDETPHRVTNELFQRPDGSHLSRGVCEHPAARQRRGGGAGRDLQRYHAAEAGGGRPFASTPSS